jgi:hypothetical protein
MEHSPSVRIEEYTQLYQTFMEPEGLLLCSQEPSIGPYPEPDKSNPHTPTLFPWDPF